VPEHQQEPPWQATQIADREHRFDKRGHQTRQEASMLRGITPLPDRGVDPARTPAATLFVFPPCPAANHPA
jgi:hypothetical protein